MSERTNMVMGRLARRPNKYFTQALRVVEVATYAISVRLLHVGLPIISYSYQT